MTTAKYGLTVLMCLDIFVTRTGNDMNQALDPWNYDAHLGFMPCRSNYISIPDITQDLYICNSALK